MKKLLVTLVFCLSFVVLQAQCPEGLITSEKNLIKNGDFEESEANFKTDYIQHTVGEAGRFAILSNPKSLYLHFVGKSDGKFMAVDGSTGANKIVWQQEIEVKENTVYFFSTWVSNLLKLNPAVLQFSINGKLIGKPFHTPAEQGVWKQFFVNWDSGDNKKATITIVSQNLDSNGNDFGLDRIKFYECVASSLEAQLTEMEQGKVIELRNVLFETASSKIAKSSFSELNLLTKYLQDNPSVEIEIAGHTDSVGDESYNLRLSQDRADAIGKYLIDKGTEAKRLTMKGYGKEVPVASNETMEGRQKNRRVEFRITKL
ncbi:OmpA family protein [Pontibacter russatus]|uniref:OmpA family protein n=1 Tax=Pontibacter russatus TaxID=2694929 RepID=UPI00137B4F4D|nr:OmpA family protein [Pontibacter russatus]